MPPVTFICRSTLAAVILLSVSPSLPAADTEASARFFESRIRPVLVKHCYECHSASAAREGQLAGGLQLDTREGIRRGGDSGPAVVPGEVRQSLLLAALRHERDLKMPPDAEPLPASVISDFEQWIASGAADPRDGQPVRVAFDFDQARQHWSFQPVTRPPVPAADSDWPRQELDHFVLARLQAAGLQPVPAADHQTLIRRLFFDLIGLPPSPDDLTRLREAPVHRIVDELLASPRFGERWARHWLDIARYAESNGRARNMAWHHAWRYRNWVIDALNNDLPYDRFVTEQIAGDLLPADSVEQRDRQLIATAFLALGPKSLEERNRELFRMDLIDEQIDVISRGVIGISMSCARCHDHKFDPVPTADYYALAGILASTETLYGIGPMGIRGVNDSRLAAIGPNAEQLAVPAAEHLQACQEKTQERNTARSDRYRIVRKVADLKRRQSQQENPETAEQIEMLEAEIAEWDKRIEMLDAELEKLVHSPPPQPSFTMGAVDAERPNDCHIRIRGEPANHGELVARSVPRMITVPEPTEVPENASGRQQLARWLTSPSNPLTPRVFVNRVWQHLFERGLVTTPDDFGVTGARPSHPELLDFLAAEFIRHDWSIKQLIRTIVLSQTYQLASVPSTEGMAEDPDNVLLWRMPVRRLEVEPFRDALLAVSGRLTSTPPGGSVVQQIGVFSDYEFNSQVTLTPEMLNSSHRSVYLPIVRGALPEMLQLFDFADPGALIGQRDQTTVPAQALFLMNSPEMLAYASDTADRVLTVKLPDDGARLSFLYELALGRLPTKDERDAALAFVRRDVEHRRPVTDGNSPTPTPNLSAIRREVWISVCHAILASSEFRHLR